MRNPLVRLLLFMFLAHSVSCATVRSVSLTSIPKNRKSQVSAEVSKFVFLAFNFDNDFADKLVPKLKRKCKGGVVDGIFTKHESYFYLIGYTMKITARGICNKISRADLNLPPPPKV